MTSAALRPAVRGLLSLGLLSAPSAHADHNPVHTLDAVTVTATGPSTQNTLTDARAEVGRSAGGAGVVSAADLRDQRVRVLDRSLEALLLVLSDIDARERQVLLRLLELLLGVPARRPRQVREGHGRPEKAREGSSSSCAYAACRRAFVSSSSLSIFACPQSAARALGRQ